MILYRKTRCSHDANNSCLQGLSDAVPSKGRGRDAKHHSVTLVRMMHGRSLLMLSRMLPFEG